MIGLFIGQARKLKKEKGILATPKNYSREGINRATNLLITEFYECDAVSRICPEKEQRLCKHKTRRWF